MCFILDAASVFSLGAVIIYTSLRCILRCMFVCMVRCMYIYYSMCSTHVQHLAYVQCMYTDYSMCSTHVLHLAYVQCIFIDYVQNRTRIYTCRLGSTCILKKSRCSAHNQQRAKPKRSLCLCLRACQFVRYEDGSSGRDFPFRKVTIA